MRAIDEEFMRRIRYDLNDNYDQALEIDLEDRAIADLTGA